MALTIPLRTRAGEIRACAVVDDADIALTRHRWCLDSSTGYAVRTVYFGMDGGRQRQRKLYLHREVLGLTLGDNKEADHIDGDRLNCSRSNLRVGTHATNLQNVPSQGGYSRHRGVSWQARAGNTGKWQAKGRLNGRQQHVGYFDNEEDAAAAMREFRRLHMPHSTETRSTTCP